MCLFNMNQVKTYWNNQPCNINHSKKKYLSKEYFNEVEEKKYYVEHYIPIFADFPKYKNKHVLEVGCGIGTDAVNFARNSCNYTGIELSDKSLEITKERFKVFNLNGTFYNTNFEDDISFLGDQKYDLIYSFGVIHHSKYPNKIIENCYKLLKPGGELKIMLYSKNSIKNFLILNNGAQFEAQKNCPHADTYNIDEINELLVKFKNIQIKQGHIFPYKIPEYKKNIYIKEDWIITMPDGLFEYLETQLGWHYYIKAIK